MSDFRNSTVYQIYVKSFCDSNGDGIGDLNGIRSKLPYLKALGVDYIWITPFFKSPMNDNGYDVADYYSVNPIFGTMEDAEAMIAEANELHLGLMFDMVFNHTSTDHEWFQKALTGDPNYMKYYIFKDPVGSGADRKPAEDASEEEIQKFAAEHCPTNWVSKFGGSAWEYVPSLGKYYLHLFDKSQADLNWENPEVREELKNVIRFWKDKGLKGFRFDVVNLISKPELFEDDYEGDGRRFYTDGRHVHEFLHELVEDTGIADMMTVGEMSSTSLDNCVRYANPASHELKMVFSFHHLKIDDYEGDGRRFYTDGRHVHEFLHELVEDTGIADMMTVGEMSSTSLDNCVRYANPASHELKMVFSFHHLKIDYLNGQKWALKDPDFTELRSLFKTWQEGMEEGNAWNAVFWENHDQPRVNSRFGDVKHYWKESSKMLATMTHMMRGTPYIYEGEEIGMTNAGFTRIEQYKDVESINYYRILLKEGKTPEEALHILGERSRDNGRTPMQWDTSENAGFTVAVDGQPHYDSESEDPSVKPWIGIPENHSYINVVSEEEDKTSVLNYYKKLIRLRKEYEIIADGSIHFTDAENENIISYERELEGRKLHVFCNVRGTEQKLLKNSGGFDAEGMKLLIDSYDEEEKTFPENTKLTMLRPYEAVVVLD